VGGALTCIAPIRPLQLCADGGYQPSLGVLGVPLIMVPDSPRLLCLTSDDAFNALIAVIADRCDFSC
jgi:hypothetical protein